MLQEHWKVIRQLNALTLCGPQCIPFIQSISLHWQLTTYVYNNCYGISQLIIAINWFTSASAWLMQPRCRPAPQFYMFFSSLITMPMYPACYLKLSCIDFNYDSKTAFVTSSTLNLNFTSFSAYFVSAASSLPCFCCLVVTLSLSCVPVKRDGLTRD